MLVITIIITIIITGIYSLKEKGVCGSDLESIV